MGAKLSKAPHAGVNRRPLRDAVWSPHYSRSAPLLEVAAQGQDDGAETCQAEQP